MRPSIQKLCGIDPSEFKTDCIKDFLTRRIDALKTKQREIAQAVSTTEAYEVLSALSYEYKYTQKAIEANVQDFEEIFGTEGRKQ